MVMKSLRTLLKGHKSVPVVICLLDIVVQTMDLGRAYMVADAMLVLNSLALLVALSCLEAASNTSCSRISCPLLGTTQMNFTVISRHQNVAMAAVRVALLHNYRSHCSPNPVLTMVS